MAGSISKSDCRTLCTKAGKQVKRKVHAAHNYSKSDYRPRHKEDYRECNNPEEYRDKIVSLVNSQSINQCSCLCVRQMELDVDNDL